MAITEKTQKPRQSDSKTMTAVAIWIVGILLVGGVIYGNSGDSDGDKKAKPKATYTSNITDHTAIDPATLKVGITVKNTSNVAGTPVCTVSVSNATSTYQGFDTFAPNKTLQPGEQWAFQGTLTVTKEGAAYITEGNASCA